MVVVMSFHINEVVRKQNFKLVIKTFFLFSFPIKIKMLSVGHPNLKDQILKNIDNKL